MSYLIEIKAYKIKSTKLWCVPDFDASEYSLTTNNNGSSPILVKCDKYGRYGSGRAIILNGISIKGCGPTPLINKDASLYYKSGNLTLNDAVVDAIYLGCMKHLFPDAIAPKAVLLLNQEAEFNLQSAINNRIDVESFEHSAKFTSAAMLLREVPTRLTNLPFLTSEEAFKLLTKHNPELVYSDKIDLIKKLLQKYASKQAELWVRRIATGAGSPDNYDLCGNPFDVSNMTTRYDFRNTYYSSERILFWDEGKLLLKKTAKLLVEVLLSIEEYEQAESIYLEMVDYIWEARRLKVLKLFGLNDEQISTLVPSQYFIPFTDMMFKALKAGTEVDKSTGDQSDFYCDMEPVTGNWYVPRSHGTDFRQLVVNLLSNLDETDLQVTFDLLFKDFPNTNDYVNKSLAICKELLSIRPSPEVSERLTTLLDSEIGEFINNSVEEFKTTVGII